MLLATRSIVTQFSFLCDKMSAFEPEAMKVIVVSFVEIEDFGVHGTFEVRLYWNPSDWDSAEFGSPADDFALDEIVAKLGLASDCFAPPTWGNHGEEYLSLMVDAEAAEAIRENL